MTPDTFVDIIIRADASELGNIGRYYSGLSARRREELVLFALDRAAISDEGTFLRMVGFIGGTLALIGRGLSTVATERLVYISVNRCRATAEPTSRFKFVVAAVFQDIEGTESVRQIGLPFLKELFNDEDVNVKRRALEGIGRLFKARGFQVDALNADIFAFLDSTWHDERQHESVRDRSLHALSWAQYAGEEYEHSLALIVLEALESESREFRHTAMWIMGDLSQALRCRHR